MFHRQPRPVAFRGYIFAVCLALLAGCNVPQPPALSTVAAPTNLTSVAGNARVTLTWTASSGAASYNVKRAVNNGGPYGVIAASVATTYTDTSVANGTTYYYVVSASDSQGEGVDSAQTAATPTAPTTPPSVPANVAATAGDSQVTLTWTASAGADSYLVKRATVRGGPYTQIATPTTTLFTNTSLTNGTTYYYVVSALNSFGESANSAEVSTSPSPPPPTTFGTWTDVTPAGVDLTSPLCSNFGAKTVQVDPVHPSNLYTSFDCQGIWKSTDYGLTWTGPINAGANAADVAACSGGLAIAPSSTASVPTIYQSCIRGGAGTGFWRSIDAGVHWTQIPITPTPTRQDYYPPVADPYDPNHLLMAAHEFDSIVESIDGGLTWTSVALASGMIQNTASGAIFFIDTGTASTTRKTWLWMGDGNVGTWRTTNGGVGGAWTHVDNIVHFGNAQIYQPDKSGVVFIAGANSSLGSGVLRSTDYGQTWMPVGGNSLESVVVGTPKVVYSMRGFSVGIGGSVDPAFQLASQPGTGTWVTPSTPPALGLEGVAQITVVNDGTHNILLGAMWNSGVWRYVEP